MEKFYISRDRGTKYDNEDSYYSLWEGKPKLSRKTGMFYSNDISSSCIGVWGETKFPYKNIVLEMSHFIEVEFFPVKNTKKIKKVKNTIKIGDHFYLKGKLFFVSETGESGITAKMDPVPDPNEKCMCGNGKKYKNCCGKKV